MPRNTDFPLGVAQQQVLDALGLKASGFNDANALFERIGIRVTSKRQGRTTVPVVHQLPSAGGAFNAFGEGETWEYPREKVDLSPIEQWAVKD